MRKFGIVAFFFFGAVGLATGLAEKIVFCCIFSIMSITGALIFFLPNRMRPVYLRWVRIGESIGKVVTMVILTIAYYGAVTPYGLMLRLFRKKLLPMRPDQTMTSYWVTRSEPAQPADRFYKRY